ncbi:hypothetical protein Pst134EB_014284 [Puccinia striiformis f. sp. tritici]|nr:hypothetical protein Pst134EB_014284 [Puccinia striiformis f. sp. tritici]
MFHLKRHPILAKSGKQHLPSQPRNPKHKNLQDRFLIFNSNFRLKILPGGINQCRNLPLAKTKMWFPVVMAVIFRATLILAADSPIFHKISVRNKCKLDFTMIVPTRGIFTMDPSAVKGEFIIYGDFNNVTAYASVGDTSECGLWEDVATGPCTTAVFTLNNGRSTGHIDLIPPRKYNHSLRMIMTNRVSKVACASANCTTAFRKAGDKKGVEIEDPGDFTGIVLEFCY